MTRLFHGALVAEVGLSMILLLGAGCNTVPEQSHPEAARSSKSRNFDPERINKFAVEVADASGSFQDDPAILKKIEDKFIHPLLEKGYTVAGRSDVTAALKELRFEQSGLTEKDAARLGQFLNVQAVVLVNITEANDRYDMWNSRHNFRGSVDARLIQSESAEILWQGSMADGEVRSGFANITAYDFEPVILRLAETVGNSFPSRAGYNSH